LLIIFLVYGDLKDVLQKQNRNLHSLSRNKIQKTFHNNNYLGGIIMIKRLLLCAFFISSSLTAQIKLSSCGAVAIGTNPDCTYNWIKLHVEYNNNDMSYGIWGRANGTYRNYGVYGAAHNGSNANYAIYGDATGYGGSNKWAGYFAGNVYATGSYQSSDEQLKKNIFPLNGKDILSKIGQIKPVRFEFLSEAESRQKGLPLLGAKEGEHIGLLAQEVEKIFPELVMDVVSPLTDENGMPDKERTSVTIKAIDYNGLIVALLSAVQEQQARIEELERKISTGGN
jgi:hypothetical protein